VVKEKATVNEDEKALIQKYKTEIEELKKKLDEAQLNEEKIKELQENNQNQQVEELKRELAEQEEVRSSFEEKIKQLTKLILVSATVDGGVRNRTMTSVGGVAAALNRTRSVTMKRPMTPIMRSSGDYSGNEQLTHSLAHNLTHSMNVNLSLSSERTPMRDLMEENQIKDAEYDQALQKANNLEKINEALFIKIEALQQQSEWREKQLNKLKIEVKDRDDRIKELLSLKLAELKNDSLEKLKLQLMKQYSEQLEKVQEELKEKEMQVEVHRADSRLLCEKLIALESNNSKSDDTMT